MFRVRSRESKATPRSWLKVGLGFFASAALLRLGLVDLPGHGIAGLALAQEAAKAPTNDAEAAKKVAKAAAESAKSDAGAAKSGKPAVSENEVISFRQAEVAAEMDELEQRMFRLSEALKQLEPDNASRLMLGLKFAREEQILLQMKETQELLNKAQLGKAAGEAKQLLAKLERLHALLLASDLDFQMQLEQLRLMREALRRLDLAIKEEDREHTESDDTAKKQKELDRLKKRQEVLDELIRREQTHIDQSKPVADLPELNADGEQTLVKVAEEQTATRQGTAEVARLDAEAGAEKSENLETAQSQMGTALESLAGKKAAEAVPPEQAAKEALEKEKQASAEKIAELEKQIAEANFQAMKSDQMGNRQLTDGTSELVRKLGERGAGALSEMTRASESMSNAEGNLGQGNAESAEGDQKSALDSLKYAKSQLEEEQEKLLEQLRTEVKKKVLEGLTIMLEKQIAIREATQSLGPKAMEGSRQALTAVVGLGGSEAKIAAMADELITLVEETEFGIALPAALGVVRDEMVTVQSKLEAGDASENVVHLEQEIEADLQALLDAMKRLPPQKPPKNGKPQKGPRDKERELNRLIAELKMIRILQTRVNRETVTADGKRVKDADDLSASLQKEIEDVTDRQENVRDATERLAEERGDEIQ